MIRFTQREKLLTVASAMFVLIWSLYALAVKPATARIATLNRVIPQKRSELEQLQSASKEYLRVHNSLADLHSRMASQGQDFELLPFLESLTQQHNLAEHAAMKPQTLRPVPGYTETVVEVELQDVKLSQIIKFVSAIDSSKIPARTRTLHIMRDATNRDRLHAVVEIHSAKLDETRNGLVF
jgi:hypothetical protein